MKIDDDEIPMSMQNGGTVELELDIAKPANHSGRTILQQPSVSNVHSDDYEEELRHQREMMRHVKEELEKVHQQEIRKLRNEKSEIVAELKSAREKVEELQNIMQSKNEAIFSNGNGNKVTDEMKRVLREQKMKVTELESKIKILENLNKQVELDNETLAYKLTEALSQYDDLEDQLRRERHKNIKDQLIKGKVEDSPSKLRVDSLHSLLDNKISTAQNELSMVNQIKKLQVHLNKMQSDLMEVNHRNEVLMIKYQQRKARYRERLHKLKGEIEEQLHEWQRKLQVLNSEKELAEVALQKEKEWRAKVEQDCMKLLEEKRQLLLRLVESEEVYRSEKVITYYET